jgi:ABC-type glycerol-3-phosphate transport system permease component
MTAFDAEAVDAVVEAEDQQAEQPARRRRGEPAIHISLFIIGAIVALPIVVAIFTSVTPLSDILRDPNSVWTPPWTFDNFVTAWTATPFGRFMVNSFIQTGLITIAQVLFSILAAYAFAMFRFPGRNVMFAIVLGSLMVPFELTFIPNFVLRQFFMALPRDLYDAAKIDGATDWYYLWKVVVPLSKGAIAALTIFSFLGAWNQYLWPLVITNEESMRTAQIGIRFFLVNQERATDWGAIMAGATIVMLPTLLVFLIAQKQLVKGIAMSGLKG